MNAGDNTAAEATMKIYSLIFVWTAPKHKHTLNRNRRTNLTMSCVPENHETHC